MPNVQLKKPHKYDPPHIMKEYKALNLEQFAQQLIQRAKAMSMLCDDIMLYAQSIEAELTDDEAAS
jgi:hypothetical protein